MYVCICHNIRDKELDWRSVQTIRDKANETRCCKCLKYIIKRVSKDEQHN